MGDATVMVMVQVHAGDVRHDGAGPEDHGNQSNVLSGHRDVLGTCKGMDTSADPMESISTHQNTMQTQILPVGCDEAKLRSCVGMLNMQVDMHGVAYHMNTAGDMQEHVSTCPENPKLPDSPTGSAMRHTGEMDRLEAHAGMQRAHTHVHHIGNNSNRPAKTSIMPEATWRGCKASRMH